VARILIAEDDPRVASLLEKGLRANGYQTSLADDGEQAQRLGLTDDFDLMILDMGLPERDGFQVLQELRTRGQTLPVIVLTGRTEREAAACLEAGADDYMRKPFHLEELLARVRKRLRARAELDRLERIVDELELPRVGETDPVRPERNASA
jgi:two-component system, OmpR family, response regulator